MPAMDFTTNQWIILALVLLLGWVLGLASRSGGARWKREAAEERRRADAADARIAASNARIAELERELGNRDVGPATAASIGAAAGGRLDDLSLIRGIGRTGETRLNDLGYHRFGQIASLSDHEAAEVEGRLGADPGTIAREEWREQAALLAKDGEGAHRARYGDGLAG